MSSTTWMRAATAVGVVVAGSVVGLVTPAAAAEVTTSPSGTVEQVVTIPAGVCSVQWDVVGGGGGSGWDYDTFDMAWYHLLGGNAKVVHATMSVSAGDQFFVQAGGRGTDWEDSSQAGGLSGTHASGGDAGPGFGGSGGGASIVRSGNSVAGTALVVAAGGGGAGYNAQNHEGGNAGSMGSNGLPTGGGAGTSSAGGAGGVGGTVGGAGSANRGGNATGDGGGGGGGAYGGGAGSSSGGAGGGGSSLVPAGATAGFAGGQDAGSVDATFTYCVPGAPTITTLTAGHGSADLVFQPSTRLAPAVTGWEVSLDGGAWAALTTAAGTAGARTATLTSLTNGQAYGVRVRATSGSGPGAASTASNVTPVAPAPGAAAGVTATAGTSSVAVSWAAPTSGGPVDHYVVTASPGPATCTTTTLSCLLGGTAGTGYTVTVTAVSSLGVSGPGTAVTTATPVSAPVVAPTPVDAPLTLTTDQGRITTVELGQDLVVLGAGFAPYSTASIVIYSTPTLLGTVVTDANGNFSKPVRVPATLAAGSHSVLAYGVDPAGNTHSMRMDVTVGTGAAAPSAPSSSLASTGADIALPLTGGLAALLAGAGLWTAGRRRRGVVATPPR